MRLMREAKKRAFLFLSWQKNWPRNAKKINIIWPNLYIHRAKKEELGWLNN
jgi:hypothetical protein